MHRRDDDRGEEAGDEAELERHQRGVAGERRERVDAAMREVEHPACREDQREAERDQRIDAAGDDAVDGELSENAHCVAPATTVCRSVPMPWMMTSTLSPTFMPPMPGGAPVRIRSPGSSVITREK